MKSEEFVRSGMGGGRGREGKGREGKGRRDGLVRYT